MNPRLNGARSSILFADHVVQLARRLPIQYEGAVIEPGETVTSGTINLATGTKIELSNNTAVCFYPSNRGVGAGGASSSDDEDSDEDSGEGGNDTADDEIAVPLVTYIRISNHSAEVSIDAKIIDQGDDVPYIEPRDGSGTLVKPTKWVAAIEQRHNL